MDWQFLKDISTHSEVTQGHKKGATQFLCASTHSLIYFSKVLDIQYYKLLFQNWDNSNEQIYYCRYVINHIACGSFQVPTMYIFSSM